MWPFTSRRIFGNRWWAIGFVLFICWQVADSFDDKSAATDITGTPVTDEQLRQMEDTLNTLQKN